MSTITTGLTARASRTSAVTLFLVLVCTACGPVKNPPPPPSIRFTAEIPAAPPEMPAYKLSATRAPVEFLNEKLGAARQPTLNLDKKTYVARVATGGDEHDRVRAFADTTTGDVSYIPNLAELAPASMPKERVPAERLQGVARSALGDERFIPRDETRVRIADPIAVMGGATTQASAPSRTDPRVVMTMTPAFRYVSDYRVYGRGSRALVTVANDGSIVGAVRRWRTATPGERVASTRKPEEVRAEIERQLRTHVPEGSQAIVDKIVLAYYDDNANYLQPVYRFEATVQPPDRKISDIRIAGYVPVGKLLEPIPDLAARPRGDKPGTPKRPPTQGTYGALTPAEDANLRAEIGGAGTPDDITLGEYANQDWPNDGGYVSMSYSFLNGLTFLNSILPGFTPPVTRTQWYVAYPWEVVGPSSKYFMNAVNVAYTVPHGDWLINSTRSNCCDLWNVADIGTNGNPGYGAGAGGVLATWVIMSCEVIPAMIDRQREIGGSGNGYTAFDAWWPVFQGMHNAIGFRTIMFYPDDNLQWGFGFSASLGGDVNAAWFQEVAANDGDDGTYASQHLIGAPQVHYDRASTMIDARNLGQSIYNVGAQGAATTLWNFWMND